MSGIVFEAASTLETKVGAADEAELAKLGYKQELKRDWSLLQNFGVSFSIISVITGISSLFLYGLNTGGPAAMVWGWIVVSFFTMMVGLAMGELCSSIPTSGGPYWWAHKVSTPEWAPFNSWITGWFNLLGQVAVTTGISFACANFIATAISIGHGWAPSPGPVLGIYAAVLASQGLINTFGVHLLKYLNTASIWWHAVGTTSLAIAVVAKAPKHMSAKDVFQKFVDGTGVGDPAVGWSERASPAYVAIIGILLSQYTLTGFDASAHMSEETHNAALYGSYGIIIAIGVSAILGWFLLLCLLFSIQDYEATVGTATGQPVAQIFLDTVGEKGAIALLVVIIVSMYFCGTFSVTSNSRMMWSFARDGALPGSSFLRKVDRERKSPVRTVWLACTLSFLLAIPSVGSAVAFSAATSIATMGLYISYGIPIGLRVLGRKRFTKGPFHLGKLSIPIAAIAVTWILFISIVFVLPEENPVGSQTLNYTIVAVGIIVSYSLGFWLISARKWFTGPVKQIEAEQRGIDGMDSEQVAKLESESKERFDGEKA